MGQRETFSVLLTPDMATLVRQVIEKGEYSSASEVIEDALRGWNSDRTFPDEDVKRLRAAWQEATTQGRPGLEPGPVFDRVQAKFSLKSEDTIP